MAFLIYVADTIRFIIHLQEVSLQQFGESNIKYDINTLPTYCNFQKL